MHVITINTNSETTDVFLRINPFPDLEAVIDVFRDLADNVHSPLTCLDLDLALSLC